MKVEVFTDSESMSMAAATLIVKQARFAVRETGRFSIALSGGSTPERTYELLALPPLLNQLPWEKTHVFWGDERCVAKDDPRHNALMARKKLLSHVPIPPNQIYPIVCDRHPQETAEKYEQLLHGFFGTQDTLFDLMLLGIGNDGHTASLFPGTPALKEKEKWVTVIKVETHEFSRITLTVPVINRSKKTLVLVEGGEKAAVLKEIIEGERDSNRLPAQLISPDNGDLLWLVDYPAASLLNKKKYGLKV